MSEDIIFDSNNKTIILNKRDFTFTKQIKVKKYTGTYEQFNPSKTIYTGATVGGITTGGFHQTKAYYSTQVMRTSGHYLYAKVDEPFTIEKVKLSPELIEEAKQDERVKKFLRGNTLILNHENQMSSAEADVIKNAISTGNISLSGYMLQKSYDKSLLSYKECQDVLEWICNFNTEESWKSFKKDIEQSLKRATKALPKVAIISSIIIAILIAGLFIGNSIYQKNIEEKLCGQIIRRSERPYASWPDHDYYNYARFNDDGTISFARYTGYNYGGPDIKDPDFEDNIDFYGSYKYKIKGFYSNMTVIVEYEYLDWDYDKEYSIDGGRKVGYSLREID